MFITQLLKTIILVLILIITIFCIYIIKYRSFSGFFKYIGLCKPNTYKAYMYSLILTLTSLILLSGPLLLLSDIDNSFTMDLYFLNNINTIVSCNICIFILISIFKSALLDEILFRGFIGKQLINCFGFNIGNAIQAILYGILNFLFFTNLGKINALAILLANSIIGYLMGHLVEKISNGSILPAWFSHSLINICYFYALSIIL